MKKLVEDIASRNFKPVYLLFGEERYLIDFYKNRLKNALIDPEDSINLNRYEGKNIAIPEVVDQAETMPFFAKHRLILIENSGFFKNAAEQLVEYLPNMPAETVMLFVESEVDKRSRLYKTVKSIGSVVEMEHLKEDALTTWIIKRLQKNGKQITRAAMGLLLERTGNDMEHISNELEKLISYTMDKGGIGPEDVDAICTVRTENRIFDMIRAIAEKNQKRALELYDDLLALKEPPLRILALISRQFNLIIQVKDLRSQGLDQQTIASKTGVQAFVVRNCLRQAEYFSAETLRLALEECARNDEDVKSGRMNDRLGVEMLIVKYSS